jgi:hypothetical protein
MLKCSQCSSPSRVLVNGACVACNSLIARRNMHKSNNPDNQEETALVNFMTAAGIKFIRPDRIQGMKSTLDFYLPDYDVSIEVKAWSTERLHNQISLSGEDGKVIVLVGMQAVQAFIALVSTFLRHIPKGTCSPDGQTVD